MRPVQIFLTNSRGRIQEDVDVPGAVLARKLSYCDPATKKLEKNLSQEGRKALQKIRFNEAHRKAIGRKNQIGSFNPGAAAKAAAREDHTIHLYNVGQRSFPIGLLEDVREILLAEGIWTEVVDQRHRPEMTEPFELLPEWKERMLDREYQTKAASEALSIPRCLFNWGTSSGKTLVMAALISKRKVKTLVVAPNRPLLHQLAGDMQLYLGYEPGIFYGEKKELRAITVGLIDSVHLHVEKIAEFGFQQVIIDEARLSAAKRYVVPCEKIDSYYLGGFDGSAWREGGDDIVLTALYGKDRPEISTTFLREQGFVADVAVRFHEVRHKVDAKLEWDEKYSKCVVHGKHRNLAILEVVQDHLDNNRRTMVLVERIEHVEELESLFKKTGLDFRVTTGRTKDLELAAWVEEFKAGKCPLMLTNVLDFGFNDPGLAAVVHAAGLKAETSMWQKIGRAERKDGDAVKYFDDFLDRGDPLLFEWSRKRMLALESKGYQVPSLEILRKEEAEEAKRKEEEVRRLKEEFEKEEQTVKDRGETQDNYRRRGKRWRQPGDLDTTAMTKQDLDNAV